MQLKAGSRLRSATSTVEVIVVRATGEDVEVTCGGVPMISKDDTSGALDIIPGHEGEIRLGKRYSDETLQIEVLCTTPGDGALEVDGRILDLKNAKALPASD